MTGKDFDKRIGDALRNYGERPPEGLFNRIESSLSAGTDTGVPLPAPRRRSLPGAVRYAVAAAILAGALILPAVKLSDSVLPEVRMAVRTETAATASKRQTAPELPTRTTDRPSTSLPAASGTSRNDTALPDTGTDDATAASKPTEQTETTAETQSGIGTGTADNAELCDEKPAPNADSRYDRDIRRRADAYWDSFAARHSDGGKNGGNRFSASLYAGNNGLTTGDMRSGNPDMAVRSGMLIAQSYDNGSSPHFGLSDAHGKPAQTPAEPASPADIDLRHAMPVTVGLSLAIPVAERISITTGMNYTYLYSSNTQKSGSESGSITRELHYLGIPVGVLYTVYSAGGFNFYVQGGGMIEKGVAWKERIDISTAEDSGTETFDRRIRGVQLSVNATAGISYNFTRLVGLYLEPGVSYYFPSQHQPANYRTENPTNFSLKAGLRFSL